MQNRVRFLIVCAASLQLACASESPSSKASPDQPLEPDPSSAGDDLTMSNDGATSSSDQQSSASGRARPVESPGEVTLDWDGLRRLGAWSAELQIFEGAPAADWAELSVSAEQGELRFSFSSHYAKISPADMAGLAREYELTPEQRDSLLSFELSEGPLLPANGSLRITQLEENISGTFNATVELAGAARTISGEFRGPLGISCNVLAGVSDPAAGAGAELDQPGASWIGVTADHPFCAQYHAP